jgi:hypothetical protein
MRVMVVQVYVGARLPPLCLARGNDRGLAILFAVESFAKVLEGDSAVLCVPVVVDEYMSGVDE